MRMETIEDNEVRFNKVDKENRPILFSKKKDGYNLLRPKVRIEMSKSLKIEANCNAYFS